MAIRLTRNELYDMVWENPVTKVAATLGISDVALHKICRKQNIPVPPRGHWAKLAAGKPVRRSPLPRRGSESSVLVEITGSPARQLPKSILEVQEDGRTFESQNKASAEISPITTSPQIERLRSKLESVKPKKDGFIRISGKTQFSIFVTPDTKDRALLSLERIVSAAINRGYDLVSSESGLMVQIDGETIALSLTETTKRVPHEATPAQAARLERWERAYQNKVRRGEWASTWDRPDMPEFDEVASGQLAIEIDQGSHYDGLRRRFSDGKRQRVENLAEKIVTAAATCAAAAIERRLEAESWGRECEEREKQRREFERQRILEEKRWEFLESKMVRMEKAQFLERFVSEYSANYDPTDLPDSCQKLLAWASSRAASIRSEISPDHLASILDKHDLMNDDTLISSWVNVNS